MSEAAAHSRENSAIDHYHVYLYDLPKLNEEGTSVPTDPAETREFTVLEEARSFAAERRRDFDRIVLVKTTGGVQQLIERFCDGAHVVSGSAQEASPA